MTILDEAKKVPLAEVFQAFFPSVELKRDGHNMSAICVLHSEKTGSFKIKTETNRWKCFGNANCGGGSALDLLVKAKLAETLFEAAKLIADKFDISMDMGGSETSETVKRLTVAELAAWKNLDEKFLRDIGLRNAPQGVLIPYLTVTGELYSVRYRVNTEAEPRFRWASGSRLCLYGLDRLREVKRAGWCLLIEGESDSWTAWAHKVPALGVPGKTTWRSEWAKDLAGITIYAWQEPDAVDFAFRIARDLTDLRIIEAPEGIKDLSEAHLQGIDVPALVEKLKATAIPAEELLLSKEAAERARLKREAGEILGSPDPLEDIKCAIRQTGYGGNLNTPLLVYLAATSRLLKMRRGILPVHLELLATPSSGKSYAADSVLLLLPRTSWHRIYAGSSRVLIYDESDLKHKVLVFDEIDSLPGGDDNPAASALRNLLQEHCLKYSVVVYDPDQKKYVTQEITKPGPTVLITTGTKRLEPQLDSRVFCIEIPEDASQIKEALATQAKIEIEGIPEPNAGTIAFQAYLQTLAPLEVVVPFDRQLVEHLSKTTVSPRILRDHPRILSLIKAVTILRHMHRKHDKMGRLISTVEDYAAVYEIIKSTYAAASSGASEGVRQAVGAVVALRLSTLAENVTVTAVAKRLKSNKASVSRRVNVALDNGWLVNKTEKKQGKSYDLDVGEPLPDDESSLPKPESLIDCSTVAPESREDIPRVYDDNTLIDQPSWEERKWPN